MKPGRAGTMHDYKRNGTTDLALNVVPARFYDCREHHTGKDVLQFFKLINLSPATSTSTWCWAHMGPEVTDWLAHPKRGRWQHFTPTSSWLNIIELVQRTVDAEACSPAWPTSGHRD